MSNNNTNVSGGIGFFGLLTLIFITLKLTHVITWSWWWVVSPLWLPFIVILSLYIFIVIVEVIKEVFRTK